MTDGMTGSVHIGTYGVTRLNRNFVRFLVSERIAPAAGWQGAWRIHRDWLSCEFDSARSVSVC